MLRFNGLSVSSKNCTLYNVPDDAPITYETMGTKKKFWFNRDGRSWLFKYSRPGQGQHWAEVLSAYLALQLGLSYAPYELACYRGDIGVITPIFIPNGFELVHGNELLFERDSNYPREGKYGKKEHTINAVKLVISDKNICLPIDWMQILGIESPVQVFAGYLLLDAWIGNTDRHHENWGIMRKANSAYLAPTYDHASSLGSLLSDNERIERLKSLNNKRTVKSYSESPKARSALYANPNDSRPLTMIDAYSAWSSELDNSPWLNKLSSISDNEVQEFAASLPSDSISDSAVRFAVEMLKWNKERILG
jgi:hypothetical protein